MATVVSRTFRSIPSRSAVETWGAIISLLSQNGTVEDRQELMAVTGIAACLITDQSPKNAPIVVMCEGPRTRIYCTYDDDAIDGSGENENPLGYNPLNGDWAISLPCSADDLTWVKEALKKLSRRINARDVESDVQESVTSNNSFNLKIDPTGFLKP